MKRLLLGCAFAICVNTIACERSSDTKSEASAKSPVSAANQAPAPPPKPWFYGEWRGEFEATANPLEMEPSEGMVKAWKEDDGAAGSGKVTLALQIDEEQRVSGTASGALGALDASGQLDGEVLRVHLSPSAEAKPADVASTYTGFAVLDKKGDTFQGTLKVSSGDSLRLRKADVTLAKADADHRQGAKGKAAKATDAKAAGDTKPKAK